MTKIVAVNGGPVAALTDLRNRTLALGSRDSGHAAILPVYFLEQEGLLEGQQYQTLRFNSDLGKQVILARARPKSLAPFSTGALMPARLEVLSGTGFAVNTWCRRAH